MSQTFANLPTTELERPLARSIKRCMIGQCPACGQSGLFKTFLSISDSCPHCGEEFYHHRADDGPPFFSMFFVAPIVVAIMVIYEQAALPPLWHHVVIGLVLSTVLCIGLIPPIKGFFVGIQWAKRMHGFGTSKTADQ